MRNVNFDDSGWPAATEYGRNGDSPSPWNRVISPIDDDAKWIWTDDASGDNKAYCRLSLGIYTTKLIRQGLN